MADTHDKKRKRYSDASNRPSKKANQAVKVSFLPDNDDLAPVIASTPGLTFPADLPLQPYKKTLETRKPSSDKDPYELLLQSSQHHKLDYTAREEHDGSAESLLKHYVGVYDPASGSLSLMSAHKLVLRSTLRSETEELRLEREAAAAKARQTNFSLRTELGQAFGTKKAKKALNSITENAINPSKRETSPGGTQKVVTDSTAEAVLQSMAGATAEMPTREKLQQAVDESKPRPKANLAATTPAEVYPPESVIGAADLRLVDIKPWLEAYEKKEPFKVISSYAARRVMNVAATKDMKKLRVLRYVMLLIDFYAALKPARSGKKLPQRDELEKKTGVSGALLDGVRRKFADGNELTKWHVDNLITHIAALTLTVDNFVVDTNDLREDLRLDLKQMTQYFLELGCKVSNPTEKERLHLKLHKAEASSHKMAKLKIPLDFPKTRQLPKRR
ncbi:RNA polymerase I associated factor, A49-like protein [Saccharata proteae CBS 121410]|uniref:RNA polymerase I associated factor, A49-like protein n=1 Tax=Saccharata proteae CBS 121410 TaxID=1314787 RepID=A0A9P4HVU7_9PEZI|nr:RNA polymerase I associated factor, A49-like protein [Saccharata proteae CBS 121410]